MEWIRNLYNTIKLGKSHFRGNVKISKEMVYRHKLPLDKVMEIVRGDMIGNMSNKIVNDYQYLIKESEEHESLNFEMSLLVLDIADFKNIVEGAISLMPQSEIDRIRNEHKQL